MPYVSPYTEFEFTELVGAAVSQLGVDWNKACDIMDPFRVDAPEWSVRYYDFDLSEMNDENYDATAEAFSVMIKIFEEHGIRTLRVLK